MGFNISGVPNTQFYVLGRGKVLLAVNAATTATGIVGLPDNSGYRHLGNAPAFATTLEVEEFTHRSSLSGFSEVDARAITSREIGLSFSLDEVSFDNLTLFYSGIGESLTNPAVAGVGAAMSEIVIVSVAAGGVVLGRWYQLLTAYDGTGDPLSMDPVNSPVAADDDLHLEELAGATTLVEGTDYEVDWENGLIFILSTATNISAGEGLHYFSDACAGCPATIDRVKALQGSNVDYSIQFVSINPLNADEEIVYEFHRVSLAADGDLNLIQENEASVMAFTGTALKNSVIDSPTGATVTVRGLP